MNDDGVRLYHPEDLTVRSNMSKPVGIDADDIVKIAYSPTTLKLYYGINSVWYWPDEGSGWKQTTNFEDAMPVMVMPASFRFMPIYFVAAVDPIHTSNGCYECLCKAIKFRFDVPDVSYLPIGSNDIQEKVTLTIHLPQSTYVTLIRIRPRSRDDVRSDYEVFVDK